jgi:hypothetical protein
VLAFYIEEYTVIVEDEQYDPSGAAALVIDALDPAALVSANKH